MSGIRVNTMSDQEAKSGDGGGALPSGLYHCVITEMEVAESQSEANPGKPLIKFTADVQDGPHADRQTRWTACCWTGALYTIVNQLKAMGEFENCGGQENLVIPDAPEFYIGRHIMVRRGVNPKRKRENPEDEPSSWIEVRGFSPYNEDAKAGAGASSSILP